MRFVVHSISVCFLSAYVCAGLIAAMGLCLRAEAVWSSLLFALKAVGIIAPLFLAAGYVGLRADVGYSPLVLLALAIRCAYATLPVLLIGFVCLLYTAVQTEHIFWYAASCVIGLTSLGYGILLTAVHIQARRERRLEIRKKH